MSSPFRGREIPPVGRELPGTARPAAAPSGAFPNWAERMRSTWEGDAAQEAPQQGNSGGVTPPNH